MESTDIRILTEEIERRSRLIEQLRQGMQQAIVGQAHLLDSLLIGLLSGGHILLEGLPGLAKTLAIKTLAQLIQADYKRIQFTPDLLPADVVGTLMYSQREEDFQVKKGPIFSNRLHPRRRDQPCPSQGTECPAGGHAGASGDHRGADLPPT